MDSSHGSEPYTDAHRKSALTNTYKVRSVLAPIYLGVLRVATAMRGKGWLFQRVDSGGLDKVQNESSFYTANCWKGIDKLIGRYKNSSDPLPEFSYIGPLMKAYSSSLFKATDLTYYHCIVSFQPYVERITKMAESLQNENPAVKLARIVKLERHERINAFSCVRDEKQYR